MRGVSSRAIAAGASSSANTSSTPVICAVAATASPSTNRNAAESAPHRHAAGGGERAIDRGEEQRTPDDREERQAHTPDDASVSTSPRVTPRIEPNSSVSKLSSTPP